MVDLHVHSTCSDGTFTPEELVDYAMEKGLRAFALTDHDTVNGLDRAIRYAEGYPDRSGLFYRRSAGIAGIDSYASGRSSGSAGFGTAYAGRIYGFSCQTTGSDKCHPCQAGRGSGGTEGGLGLHCTRRQAYGDRQGQTRSPYGTPQ